MKKRFAAGIVSAAICLSQVVPAMGITAYAAGESVKVSVTSATTTKGGTAKVDVVLDSDIALAGSEVKVTFDPDVLQVKGIVQSVNDLTNDSTTQTAATSEYDKVNESGEIILFFAGYQNLVKEGKYATIEFAVDANAAIDDYEIGVEAVKGGDNAVLTYTMQDAKTTTSYDVATTSGKITVSDRLAGDMDGVGGVTGLDVLYLKDYFAEYYEGDFLPYSDVDGDGKLTGLDVLKLKDIVVS